MTFLWSAFFLVIGMVLGSFFNVVGLRMPQYKDYVKSRSMCPQCEQPLSWMELIPVLSYVLQKGQCRSCNTSISPIYPLIEVTSGLLYFFAYVKIGFQPEFMIALLLISLSMIVIVTDLHYMIIPNRLLLFFLPLLILSSMIVPLDPWYDSLAGAIGGFLLIGCIILLTRGAMGAGDMKLLALLGLILGLKKILLTFFIAVCLGAVIGISLIVMKKVSQKQPIPFAPYLIIGAITSHFYGAELLIMYAGFTSGGFSL